MIVLFINNSEKRLVNNSRIVLVLLNILYIPSDVFIECKSATVASRDAAFRACGTTRLILDSPTSDCLRLSGFNSAILYHDSRRRLIKRN